VWRGRTRDLQELLADAIGRGGDARREAMAALDSRTDGLALGALTPDDIAPSAETTAALREVVQPNADRLATVLDDAEADNRAAALRVLAKLGDDRITPSRIAAAAFDGSPALAGAATFGAARIAATRPTLAPAVAAALAPLLGDESWRRRLAAVEALRALGPAGVPLLERTRADKHALVRAAAADAVAKRPL
jgi:HEAT repeat protein